MRSQLNVFALPYAGGSKYSYSSIRDECSQYINFHAIDLPGHISRINEQLQVDIHKIGDDIFVQIKSKLHVPYAFFGRSMGSMLAYLLTKKIISKKRQPPVHLFLSGRGGPASATRRNLHLLSNDELIKVVREMGGTPNEVLDDGNLMQYLLPILRADLQALETYKHTESILLDIPITILIGKGDKVTKEEALLWQDESIYPVNVIEFEGGHFFINQNYQQIAFLLSKLNA